jgi:hypothetical protein
LMDALEFIGGVSDASPPCFNKLSARQTVAVGRSLRCLGTLAGWGR